MHLKNKNLNKINWEKALHALIGKSPSNRHHKEDTNGNGEMERWNQTYIPIKSPMLFQVVLLFWSVLYSFCKQ